MENKNLKISGLQLDIVWKNIPENLQAIEAKLRDQEADIFLLPEMFATGFCMDVEEIADDKNKILGWMKSFAMKKNAAVGGSVAVKENGRFFNRFYFVEKTGKVQVYDKRHLFSYAKEDQHYSAGKEKMVFEYLGWKILLQTCYDLRFPVFQRNRENYDIMLNIASWPDTRILAWKTLLKARAIENQCYVFGLNRTGTDGNTLFYSGESKCFFADGTEISEISKEFITADLNREKLQEYRKKFPFLEDQDDFEITK